MHLKTIISPRNDKSPRVKPMPRMIRAAKAKSISLYIMKIEYYSTYASTCVPCLISLNLATLIYAQLSAVIMLLAYPRSFFSFQPKSLIFMKLNMKLDWSRHCQAKNNSFSYLFSLFLSLPDLISMLGIMEGL